jgi:hypothetical protein
MTAKNVPRSRSRPRTRRVVVRRTLRLVRPDSHPDTVPSHMIDWFLGNQPVAGRMNPTFVDTSAVARMRPLPAYDVHASDEERARRGSRFGTIRRRRFWQRRRIHQA